MFCSGMPPEVPGMSFGVLEADSAAEDAFCPSAVPFPGVCSVFRFEKRAESFFLYIKNKNTAIMRMILIVSDISFFLPLSGRLAGLLCIVMLLCIIVDTVTPVTVSGKGREDFHPFSREKDIYSLSTVPPIWRCRVGSGTAGQEYRYLTADYLAALASGLLPGLSDLLSALSSGFVSGAGPVPLSDASGT